MQPEQAGVPVQPAESQQPSIARMYIELDGVLARMRRGSVEKEEQEQQRPGDVYREVKVGVVFQAGRGRERSGFAPEAWVDKPTEGTLCYVAQRTALGNFARLLYTLAVRALAATGQASGGLRRWGALDVATGRGTLSGGGADRGSLACGIRICGRWRERCMDAVPQRVSPGPGKPVRGSSMVRSRLSSHLLKPCHPSHLR
jgi:hypothetical protein